MPITSPGSYLCSLLNGYKLQVPTTFLDLINLLEQSIEPRNTLLDDQFNMVKLKNSQMEEMHRTKYGERAQSLHTLSKPSPISTLQCSRTRKLSKPYLLSFYGGLLKQAWVIKSLNTSDWSNLQHIPPTPSSGEVQSHPINITKGSQTGTQTKRYVHYKSQ